MPRHDANAWQYLKGLGLVTGGKQLMQFIGHVNSWDSYQLYELVHMFLSLSLYLLKYIYIYIYIHVLFNHIEGDSSYVRSIVLSSDMRNFGEGSALLETDSLPLKIGLPKSNIVSQHLPTTHFQVRTVSFRERIYYGCSTDYCISKVDDVHI